MKKCINCGLDVQDSVSICPQCGAVFQDVKTENKENKWILKEDASDNLKPFKPFVEEKQEDLTSNSTEERILEKPVVNNNSNDVIDKNFGNQQNSEDKLSADDNKINKEALLTPNKTDKTPPKTTQKRSARSVLLSSGPSKSKFTDKEAEKYYGDDVLVGNKEDAEAIAKKEEERKEYLSKPNSLKNKLFGKEKPENKDTAKPLNVATKRRNNTMSSMFSGFADEEVDEEIKSEIAKSKENAASESLSSILNSGTEGRKKKKNNNEIAADKEIRQDVIEQRDYHEEDYDNYYEFVKPSDNMIYEKKSSFKVHFIAFILIIIGTIFIGVMVAKSGFGQILANR